MTRDQRIRNIRKFQQIQNWNSNQWSQLQNSLRPNCGAKYAYLPIIRKVHRINAMHIYERSTNLRILRSKFNSNIVLQLAQWSCRIRLIYWPYLSGTLGLCDTPAKGQSKASIIRRSAIGNAPVTMLDATSNNQQLSQLYFSFLKVRFVF